HPTSWKPKDIQSEDHGQCTSRCNQCHDSTKRLNAQVIDYRNPKCAKIIDRATK
ncbi:3333_t:CDS:1, partial [Dentiscutata erythropus]